MKITANELANKTPHLTPGQEYVLVGLDQDSYRVINDNEEPVLYERAMFLEQNFENRTPSEWVKHDYEDGEYTINPFELSVVGFYEDWFDGQPQAKEVLARFLSS